MTCSNCTCIVLFYNSNVSLVCKLEIKMIEESNFYFFNVKIKKAFVTLNWTVLALKPMCANSQQLVVLNIYFSFQTNESSKKIPSRKNVWLWQRSDWR